MSSPLHRLLRSGGHSLRTEALAAGGASQALVGPEDAGTLGPCFKEDDAIAFDKIDLIRP